jgi:nicotianamine synthase
MSAKNILTTRKEFDASTEAVLACLDICMVVHPYNHVVNSVIIGRVKPRGKRDIPS